MKDLTIVVNCDEYSCGITVSMKPNVRRTDVWGLGCLFYAWWYGYSPFEMVFDRNGNPKVSEVTYLRLLSGNIPSPVKPSKIDTEVINFVTWILVIDFKNRPFCQDIVLRLDQFIESYQSHGSVDNSLV